MSDTSFLIYFLGLCLLLTPAAIENYTRDKPNKRPAGGEFVFMLVSWSSCLSVCIGIIKIYSLFKWYFAAFATLGIFLVAAVLAKQALKTEVVPSLSYMSFFSGISICSVILFSNF